MIVLGLDTATAATAVAVLGPDGAVAEARDDPAAEARPRHATTLLPLAAGLLDQEGLRWRDLDLIAAGVGPGSFTGLRIGIATARALAQGCGVALVGVSSLRALAAAAAPELGQAAPVAAMIDARRGEVFLSAFSGDEQLLAPCALAPEAVAATLCATGLRAPGAWSAVGDGALRFRPVLEAAGVTVVPEGSGLHRVSAATICRLAVTNHAAADASVRPHYVRQPDAESNRPGAPR